MMDPDYELFVAVLQAGSLAAAGRERGISAGMVSKRIARLEARLSVKLLHRTTRRLAPTPVGERLHRDLMTILGSIDEAERRASGDAGVVSGALKVSAPTSFGRMHVAPHLVEFQRSYPGVALEFHLSDDYVDLLASRTDVVIRIGEPGVSGLTTVTLGANYRVLCASPTYVETFGEPQDIVELRRHRIVAATGQLPWRLDGPSGPASISGRSWIRTNSSEVVREVVLAGGGIALRSLWDVGRDLEEGRLVRILPHMRGDPTIAVFAGYLPGSDKNGPVPAFIEFFKARTFGFGT